MKAKSNLRTAFILLLFFGAIFLLCSVFIESVLSVGLNNDDGKTTTDSKKIEKIENKNQNKSDNNSNNNNEIKSTTKSDRAWLFVYYTNKGHDGLFYAWSKDGLLWQQLRNGKPFLKPEVGGDVKDRLTHSPSICRSSDGVYHVVWTVGWESRSIGYASSRDMINWSKQRLIPVMENEKRTRNVWNPVLFYNEDDKQYYIIWASTVNGEFKETAGLSEDNFNHRLYYTTTTDFTKFAPTKLYWNPNHNVMSPLLVEDKDADKSQRYLLFYKDDTLKPKPKKHLLLATGESPVGPFVVQKMVSHTDWVQGPSILRIDKNWYLYYDCYGKRHFGAVQSNDLINWTNITEKLCFPTNARQGTIIEIDKETLKNLQNLK
ncbi:MAG: glycoside hydrolase family 43 protein [Planctomycetaceae bacterium]|jgi:hypothetical protein|nr:glycoside hydrolase family 43 protein [Planctomycetaceae bacterium]